MGRVSILVLSIDSMVTNSAGSFLHRPPHTGWFIGPITVEHYDENSARISYSTRIVTVAESAISPTIRPTSGTVVGAR